MQSIYVYFMYNFRHDILPIAMGARPEDYERTAPYKSFIHVDQFDGPKAGRPDTWQNRIFFFDRKPL